MSDCWNVATPYTTRNTERFCEFQKFRGNKKREYAGMRASREFRVPLILWVNALVIQWRGLCIPGTDAKRWSADTPVRVRPGAHDGYMTIRSFVDSRP